MAVGLGGPVQIGPATKEGQTYSATARGPLGRAFMRALGIFSVPAMPVGIGLQPVLEMASSLPGMVSLPQREYWAAAGQVDAGGVGTGATFKIWAAPSTFNSADARTAAGIYIMHWEAKSGGTMTQLNLGVTVVEEVDPGAGAAANSLEINAVGGTPFVVGQPELQDISALRSPRAQVNASVPGAALAILIPWPSQTNTLTPRLAVYPPFYVPPGRAFIMQSSQATDVDTEFVCLWVEAEEAPLSPVVVGAT